MSGALPQTARMPHPVLIGRDEPLARLREALERGGGALLVRGEPGIGKTWLVDALAREAAARGRLVLTGRTDPDDGAPPLWPWLQALRGRPERGRLEGLAQPLPETADPAAAAQVGRAARLLAFEAVLDGLGATPTVVVLEDLHWADEPTLRLLTLAADRSDVLVVATYRDTEQSPALRAAVADLRRRGSTEVITLRPWDDAAVAALLPPGVHPSWAPVLRRTGAGLPLLVTALLQDLLDTDRGAGPAPADGAWPLGAPDRLADLTAERLARLAPAARRAVEIAAVTGAGCGPAHLGRLGEPAGRGRPHRAGERRRGRPVGALPHRRTRLRPRPRPAPRHGVRAGPRATPGALARGAGRGDRGGRPAGRAGDPSAARRDRSRLLRRRGHRVPDRRPTRPPVCWRSTGSSSCSTRPARLPSIDRETRADLELDAAAAEFAAGRAEAAMRRCRRVAAAGASSGQLVRAALTVRGLGGPLNVDIVLLCDAALAALPDDDLAGRARVLAQRALAESETVGWAAVDAPSAQALRLAERSGSPAALVDALRARQHAVSHVDGVTERLDLAQQMIALAAAGGPADAELWGRLWRIDAALQLGNLDVVDAELGHLLTLAEGLGWPIAHWHRHRMTAARLLLGRTVRRGRSRCRPRRRGGPPHRGHHRAARRRGIPRRSAAAAGTLRRGVDDPPGDAAGFASAPPIFLALAGLTMAQAGKTDEARRMLDQVRPALPRQPRDGRWIRTVARAGHARGPPRRRADRRVVPGADHPLWRLLPGGRVGIGGCDGAVARITGTLAAALGRTDEARRMLTAAIAMDERIGALPYRVLSEVELAGVRPRAGRARGGRSAGTPGRRHRPTPRDGTRTGGRRGAVWPASGPSATPTTR